jgi:hypothetical protein
MLLGAFRPWWLKIEACRAREDDPVTIKCVPRGNRVLGLRGRKTPDSSNGIRLVGVLRLLSASGQALRLPIKRCVTRQICDALRSEVVTFYVCGQKAPNTICAQASPRSFDFALLTLRIRQICEALRKDDDFVEGLKHLVIWSEVRKTQRSKKSRALRTTILWFRRKHVPKLVKRLCDYVLG